MTDREALRMALEALCSIKLCEVNSMSSRGERVRLADEAIKEIKNVLQWKEREPQAYCYTTKYGNHILSFRRIPDSMRYDYINEYPLYARTE